ncbi:MAG: DnaD domain protein [Clostridia bacterium]|nr:DnaD domain protein [Clostridia bacterium]
MALISVSDDLAKKSFTIVENKFITKYMPVLEPNAVKVYLYSLYLYQSGSTSYTFEDMAKSLSLTDNELKNYFEYLEEFELVSVISISPFEVKILEADNIYGTPKKFKPEKYADFTKNVQNVIKGRMISPNEFREYFLLLEEYGFEQNALIMIITYCVNLKGDNIRFQYIKKVAKSFADDGATTTKKVDERLSAYTGSTPSLIKIFTAAGINKQPDIDDDKLYKKWTDEFEFNDESITAAAKFFKAKTADKLDSALTELYKSKKFDVKEIEDYCKNKNSVYNATIDIARALGVYMQNTAPYIENYVNIWYNFGYSFLSMKTIANYCFKHGKNSFGDMHEFVIKLFDEGIVDDKSINAKLASLDAEDAFIKEILNACGLTRKVIEWDRQSLAKWREWNFSDEMILEAAKLSSGKSNPTAYMNGILSAWKAEGITNTNDAINRISGSKNSATADPHASRAAIEQHFYDLRHAAEDAAEKALSRATDDSVYGEIYKQINELSIELAFAEIRDEEKARNITERIAKLNLEGDKRLNEMNIDKADFAPHYSCKLCNDTGYDKDGNACECMKKYILTLK